MLLLLAGACLWAFWDLRTHRFLNYDDAVYVTGNAYVRAGLSVPGAAWAFRNAAFNWHPVTWLSHMLDVQLFGFAPGAHHLVSLLVHVANTLLLCLVLAAMTGYFCRSAVVAGLFAVHPLHVESVAWIAERKDVLCAFFWILSMGAYERYVRRPSGARMRLVGGTMLLGLMCKGMIVTLPFALLLLDYWPLRRWRPFERDGTGDGGDAMPSTTAWRLVGEKALLFALAAAGSAVQVFAQRAVGAVVALEQMPASGRVANALVSYVGYLWKTVWPLDLAVYYPPVREGLPLWQVAGAGLFLCAVSAAVMFLGRRRPYLPVGWWWYVGTLLPVIGLVQIGEQAMADRYTYLPLIGIFVLVTWGLVDTFPPGRGFRIAAVAATLCVLAGLTVATRRQVEYWRDSRTLFAHAVAVTEGNDLAHLNLGSALAEMGDLEGAIAHFEAALRIKPDSPRAHYNLGLACLRQDRWGPAIDHFRAAMAMSPDQRLAQYNLALALTRAGRPDEAATELQRMLDRYPDSILAREKLAELRNRRTPEKNMSSGD